MLYSLIWMEANPIGSDGKVNIKIRSLSNSFGEEFVN